ncbi:hypothetical protein I4U23_028180 [Adineta vaga]|nr:hypothetical protein I4U23_028180 [Adineta vaga]
MSKQTSSHWQDNSAFHYNTSIRNEYIGFACMFSLFTFLALFVTIFLSILAYNSYYHDSEVIQRRFIPYFVLGLISLLLFLIFSIGSLGYTCKLFKKSYLKQSSSSSSSISPLPTPHKTDNSLLKVKRKSSELFPFTTDESYYTSTKVVAESKSRNTSISYQACQTDV